MFLAGSRYVYEFKRKMSESEDAVMSHASTWRQHDSYVRPRGFSQGKRLKEDGERKQTR